MALPKVTGKRVLGQVFGPHVELCNALFAFEGGLGVVALDPDSASDDDLRALLWDRVEACATGTCPRCDARPKMLDGQHVEMRHESWCPVGDDNLGVVVRAHYGLGVS